MAKESTEPPEGLHRCRCLSDGIHMTIRVLERSPRPRCLIHCSTWFLGSSAPRDICMLFFFHGPPHFSPPLDAWSFTLSFSIPLACLLAWRAILFLVPSISDADNAYHTMHGTGTVHNAD